MNKLASIIVINWNSFKMTKDCLDSVYKSTKYKPFEIILIDNGSKDGSIEKLQKLFPKVRVIRNKVNKGFPYALNQGYRAAKGYYLVPLNNDAIVTENWLTEAIKVLESNPKIAVAGCTEISPEEFRDKKKLAEIKGRPNKEKFTLPVSWVTKKKMLKEVGYLDVEYFSPLYGEEADWNFRARKLGYKIMQCSKCLVIHFHSKDSQRSFGADKHYFLLNVHALRTLLFNLSFFELLKFVPGFGLIFLNSIKDGRTHILLKAYWRTIKDIPLILRIRRSNRIFVPFKEPKFTEPFKMEPEK